MRLPQFSIRATRHEADRGAVRCEVVTLDRPPVAVVSDIESIMGGWWYRAGGYPVGRVFGTALVAPD